MMQTIISLKLIVVSLCLKIFRSSTSIFPTLVFLCRGMKKLRLHLFGVFTKDVKNLRLSQAQAKKLVKKLRQETG